MLANTSTMPRSASSATSSRPPGAPGSTIAASIDSSPSGSPSACTTASWPERVTTSASSERMSSCGSDTSTRATGGWCPRAAGKPAARWYESRMNARPRVLVVDDDDDIRLLLRELLERAGYDVDVVESGRAALRQLYAAAPALVILDVTMPDLDGYQTLERIRDLSDVPVLMLTARAEELE